MVALQSGDLNGVYGMSSSRAAVCNLFGTSDQFLEQNLSIDLRRVGGEGNGTPLQSSCLEKFHGWKSLVGCSPWGR